MTEKQKAVAAILSIVLLLGVAKLVEHWPLIFGAIVVLPFLCAAVWAADWYFSDRPPVQ
jgi:hypothetical protein